MAVEVVNGRVQFKYDLGSGPLVLTSDKVVSDAVWHQVIIERSKAFAALLYCIVLYMLPLSLASKACHMVTSRLELSSVVFFTFIIIIQCNAYLIHQ